VETTIEAKSKRLKTLARNIDLLDPEIVKENIQYALSEILEVSWTFNRSCIPKASEK